MIEYGKPYRLIRNRLGHKAGVTVRRCEKSDYGCANDDTRATGIEHWAVTEASDCGYPFFTVTAADVEPL